MVAGAAAFSLALLGFWLVARTGDDVWFVLSLPVLVVVFLGRRDVARENRQAAAAWWRRRGGDR